MRVAFASGRPHKHMSQTVVSTQWHSNGLCAAKLIYIQAGQKETLCTSMKLHSYLVWSSVCYAPPAGYSIVMKKSRDSISDSPCCCQKHIFSERQQLPGFVTDARRTADRARQRGRLSVLNHSSSLSSLPCGFESIQNAALTCCLPDRHTAPHAMRTCT